MKRIRYQKSKKENEIESKRCFFNKNQVGFKVKINVETNTYRILNFKRQEVVSSTEKDGRKPPKTLYAVKQQVRKSLRKLGIDLEHEIRWRKDD